MGGKNGDYFGHLVMIKAEINESAHGPKLATETMANPQVSLSGSLASISHSMSVKEVTVSVYRQTQCPGSAI